MSTTMQGFLLKKGNDMIGRQKRRWFVLTPQPPCLAYYDKEGGARKGSVPLTVAQSCAAMGKPQEAEAARAAGQKIDCRPSGLGSSTRFEVRTPGRTYVLEANSSEEMTKWMSAIQAASDAAEEATGGAAAPAQVVYAPLPAASEPVAQLTQASPVTAPAAPTSAPVAAASQPVAPAPVAASAASVEPVANAMAAVSIDPNADPNAVCHPIDPSGVCHPLSTHPVPVIDKTGMTMAQKIAKAQQPPTEQLTFNATGELIFAAPVRLRVANNPFCTTHREFFIMSEHDRNILKAVCSPDQKSIRLFASQPPNRLDNAQTQEVYIFERGGMFGSGAWTVKSGVTGAPLFSTDAKTTFSKNITHSINPIDGAVGAPAQPMALSGDWFTFASLTLSTKSGELVAQVGKTQDIMAQCWCTVQPMQNALIAVAVTMTALLDADERAAKIDRQFNKSKW